MFPLYLVMMNIFVIPIAFAGLLIVQREAVDGDIVCVWPCRVADGQPLLAMVAFIGGLCAATAMVIVETVALSIMVCNWIVMPLMLRRASGQMWQGDMTSRILQIRRVAIGAMVVLAYSCCW